MLQETIPRAQFVAAGWEQASASILNTGSIPNGWLEIIVELRQYDSTKHTKT